MIRQKTSDTSDMTQAGGDVYLFPLLSSVLVLKGYLARVLSSVYTLKDHLATDPFTRILQPCF